jgi:hypothetical protein
MSFGENLKRINLSYFHVLLCFLPVLYFFRIGILFHDLRYLAISIFLLICIFLPTSSFDSRAPENDISLHAQKSIIISSMMLLGLLIGDQDGMIVGMYISVVINAFIYHWGAMGDITSMTFSRLDP